MTIFLLEGLMRKRKVLIVIALFILVALIILNLFLDFENNDSFNNKSFLAISSIFFFGVFLTYYLVFFLNKGNSYNYINLEEEIIIKKMYIYTARV